MNNELLQLLQQVNPAVWYAAPILMIVGGLLIKYSLNNRNIQFHEESYVPLTMNNTNIISNAMPHNDTKVVENKMEIIENQNSDIIENQNSDDLTINDMVDIDKQMAQLSTLATKQDAQYRKETDGDEVKFKKAFGHLISEEFNDLYPQGSKTPTSTTHAVWVTYMLRDENLKVFADDIFELKHAWGTYDSVTDLKIALKLKHPQQQTAVVSVFVVHK